MTQPIQPQTLPDVQTQDAMIKSVKTLTPEEFAEHVRSIPMFREVATLPGQKSMEECAGKDLILWWYDTRYTQWGETVIMVLTDTITPDPFIVPSTGEVFNMNLRYVANEQLPLRFSFKSKAGKDGNYYLMA